MSTNFAYENAYPNNRNKALKIAKAKLQQTYNNTGRSQPASQYYHEIQNTFRDPGEGRRTNWYTKLQAARNLRHNADEEEAGRGPQKTCSGILCKWLGIGSSRKTHRRKSHTRRTRRTRSRR